MLSHISFLPQIYIVTALIVFIHCSSLIVSPSRTGKHASQHIFLVGTFFFFKMMMLNDNRKFFDLPPVSTLTAVLFVLIQLCIVPIYHTPMTFTGCNTRRRHSNLLSACSASNFSLTVVLYLLGPVELIGCFFFPSTLYLLTGY